MTQIPWGSRKLCSHLVGSVGPGAADLKTLEAAGELLRGEISKLVEGQGECVLSLGVLLHVLLDQNLVVRVHLGN